jgi:hypothetical protein
MHGDFFIGLFSGVLLIGLMAGLGVALKDKDGTGTEKPMACVEARIDDLGSRLDRLETLERLGRLERNGQGR